jgi:glycosyltransferase involved in cell wall biosynthesis
MENFIKNKRILIVLRNLEVGGAERQAAYLAKFLKNEAEASVNILAFFDKGYIKNILEKSDIPLTICSPGQNTNRIKRLLQLIKFIFLIRKLKPLIIMPFTDFPNKVCGSIWKLTGAKSCFWNQRDEGREVTGKLLEKIAIKKTPLFVANSQVGKNFLTEQFKVPVTKIRVIHNGVTLAPALRSQEQWRKELRLGKGQSCAVMVANLHSFKDHKTLLKAWRIILDNWPKSLPFPVLLLAGRFLTTYEILKQQRNELKMEESVRFLGEITDISGLLATVDLAVFSSKNEGCPNAVLEYMMAQKAVVATRIIGTEEALGHEYPYLIPADDSHQFAKAVLGLFQDSKRRMQVGKQNQERALKYFSLQKMQGEYLSFIKEVIKGMV